MERLCTKSSSMKEDVSRKGAKVQSAAAFLWSFLCTFAPLRDNTCSNHGPEQNSEDVLCKALWNPEWARKLIPKWMGEVNERIVLAFKK